MPHPIVHFEITGPDAKQLQDFYRDLFDWKIDANNPMSYGFVDPGEGVKGGIMQTHGQMPHYLTVYAQVPDLAAHLKKVEKLGGSTIVPPTDIPNGGQFALFSDPAGNMMGLFKG